MASSIVKYKESRPLPLEEMRRDYCPQHQEYNPFCLTHVQTYNPIYAQFFDVNGQNYNRVAFDVPRQISGINRAYNYETAAHDLVNIHIKYSPLLDPVHYLFGKYEMAKGTCVPKIAGKYYVSRHEKISGVMNSAYIDSFFSYLIGKLRVDGMVNALEFFGSYVGVQEKFVYDISEYEEGLSKSHHFLHGEGTVYDRVLSFSSGVISSQPVAQSKANNTRTIPNYDNYSICSNELSEGSSVCFTCVDPSEPMLCFGDDEFIDLWSDEEAEKESEKPHDDEYYEDNTRARDSHEDNQNTTSIERDNEEPDEIEYDIDPFEYGGSPSHSSCNSDKDREREEVGISTFSEFKPVEVYIHNMPVHMICMEKCENTLDYLLSTQYLCEEEMQSMLLQIMFTLAVYQEKYQFVHNDLHTGNVMYSNIEQSHLEYVFEGGTYRVPTFGRVYKIIDFGRSMYVVDGVQFCSDSFAPYGDACEQYNCAPFYDDSKPIIRPNFSFDLCMFAVGLYNIDTDEGTRSMDGTTIPELSPATKTILSWCMDDEGKNIAFTSQGDERYPGFKLYKMITRRVHGHVPADELRTNVPWVRNYLVSERVVGSV